MADDVNQINILAILFFSCAAFLGTWVTFFSKGGPIVVDYWAFAAGIFLVSEGVWRMMKSVEKDRSIIFFRLLRVSIGVCIFTIHLFQYLRDGRLGLE